MGPFLVSEYMSFWMIPRSVVHLSGGTCVWVEWGGGPGKSIGMDAMGVCVGGGGSV